jgi:hypothetical protein
MSEYTCPVVLDEDGHQCIEFSDELLAELDLKVGDVLQWKKSSDEAWILTKGKTNEEG